MNAAVPTGAAAFVLPYPEPHTRIRRTMRRLFTAAVGLLLALGATSAAAAPVPAPLVLWVSPTGSDTAAGTSAEAPLASLGEVHKRLCLREACAGLGQPVEVHLLPGVYERARVAWTYFDDVHTTSFIGEGATVSVLDGYGELAWGFSFTQTRPSSSGRTNLVFRDLGWRNYLREAIVFKGSGNQRAAGNVFERNEFSDIGNLLNAELVTAWGGIFLNNSDENRIANNRFVRILNHPRNGRGQEHALYLIRSRGNIIEANSFEFIGGDAIRVRDDASNNIITANTFLRAGNSSYVGDWFCKPWRPVNKECTSWELPSYGNELRANVFRGPFNAKQKTVRITYCHDVRMTCLPERIRVL